MNARNDREVRRVTRHKPGSKQRCCQSIPHVEPEYGTESVSGSERMRQREREGLVSITWARVGGGSQALRGLMHTHTHTHHSPDRRRDGKDGVDRPTNTPLHLNKHPALCPGAPVAPSHLLSWHTCCLYSPSVPPPHTTGWGACALRACDEKRCARSKGVIQQNSL